MRITLVLLLLELVEPFPRNSFLENRFFLNKLVVLTGESVTGKSELRTHDRKEKSLFKSFRQALFRLILQAIYLFFNKSRISVSSSCSLVVAGGAAGASSCFFFNEFIPLIAKKITEAMIAKSSTVCINEP
jgi:hypothetical protein